MPLLPERRERVEARMVAAEQNDLARMLREGARTFVERSGGVARARSWSGEANGLDRDVWRQIADLGWLGLRLPQSRGGLELEAGAAGALFRELGRGVVQEPLIAAEMAAAAVATSDNEARRDDLLAAYLEGRCLPLPALQEERGAPEAAPQATVASSLDGGGWRLSGRKRFVAGADFADGLVVSAAGAGEPLLFWVESGEAAIDAKSQADGTTLCDVAFDLELGADRLLLRGDAVGKALRKAYDVAVVLQSAELLGLGERAFELTLDYLRQRRQFGSPIGAFQALQHRAVDLHVGLEMARSALGAALSALDDESLGEAERAAAGSAAKARCAAVAQTVCQQAVQMHGGMGYTEECDVGLYLRRVLTLVPALGNAAYHRARWLECQSDPRSSEPS